MLRLTLFLLTLFHALNGLFMVTAPRIWYANVPGVHETGPLNQHFAIDIGLAFLASSVSLFLSAIARVDLGRLWPAAVFLGGHAAFHLVEMLEHGVTMQVLQRDTLLILIPGFAPLFIILATLVKRKSA